MCGISAIVNWKNQAVCVSDLERMAATIAYRGPDQAGYATFQSGQVGFSHVRLSIRDLAAPPQPLLRHDGEDVYAITYSGEIYEVQSLRDDLIKQGYEFSTKTDTEVVLALYQAHGLDMFAFLNGEYAFVIWDGKQKRTVAARDRYGIKPLFYHHAKDAVYFGSEAKCLLSLDSIPRQLAPQFLTQTIWGSYPKSQSPFLGIHALPPAHYMVIQLVNGPCQPCEAVPYWRPTFPTNTTMTRTQAEAGLRSRFEKAIERRTVADVPLCTYLSGGIDSILVTGICAKYTDKLQAFNISFTGSVFDEASAAKHAAETYGVQFQSIPCPSEVLASSLVDAIYHSEMSFANASSVAKLVLSKEVNRLGYKVALTGEGSDEVLAGYPFFKLEELWRMQESPDATQRAKGRRLYAEFQELEYRSEGILWNDTKRWRTIPRPLGYPSAGFLRATVYEGLCKRVIKPKILLNSLSPTEAYNTLDNVALRSMHPLHASMVINYRQLASYIFPCLGDRLEMANHVEGRTPFLDNDLTDFIATIPPRFFVDIDVLQEKAVLYTAFKGFLPKATSQTHKHPFFAPDWATLSRSKPGKAIFKRYLSNRALAKTGLFNVQTIALFKYLWRGVVPYHTVLHRRLDAMLGTVLTVQIMHDLFVKQQPGPKVADIKFECVYEG